MKKEWMPIILFAALVDPEQKTAEEETLASLDKISAQIDTFTQKLGEKVDKESVDALTASIDELKTAIKGGKDIDGLETQIARINTENEKLHRAVVELEVERLKSKEKANSSEGKDRFAAVRKEVENYVKELFPDGKNGVKSNKLPRMSIEKATIVPEFSYDLVDGEVSAFTGRRIDPTLNQRRRKTNLILDYFNIQSIDVPELIYLRKIEIPVEGESHGDDTWIPGGADWIACGDPKPKRAFKLTTGTAKAKKVAIFNTIDDCLVQDVPSMMNWIRNDFADEIREKAGTDLLQGDGSGDTVLGLLENATQYSVTAAFDESVPNANRIDAIIAAAASMDENRETPGMVFVSKDAWYRLLVEKDLNAKYQNNNLVYTNSIGQLFIAGVQVVKVDSDDIPQDHFLMVGVDPGFKIFSYGDLVLETGLNGEDFREDKTSIRGYQRFLTYIAEERENSVMYDAFDTVISAIDAPEGTEGGQE